MGFGGRGFVWFDNSGSGAGGGGGGEPDPPAQTARVFDAGAVAWLSGVDPQGNAIGNALRAMLMTDAYVFDQTAESVTAISGDELPASERTPVTIASQGPNGNNYEVVFDDTVFDTLAVGAAPGGVVLYILGINDTLDDRNIPLLYVEFDSAEATTGANSTITWPNPGLSLPLRT